MFSDPGDHGQCRFCGVMRVCSAKRLVDDGDCRAVSPKRLSQRPDAPNLGEIETLARTETVLDLHAGKHHFDDRKFHRPRGNAGSRMRQDHGHQHRLQEGRLAGHIRSSQEDDADVVTQIEIVRDRVRTKEWMNQARDSQRRTGPRVNPPVFSRRDRQTQHGFDRSDAFDDGRQRRLRRLARQLIERSAAVR